MTGIRRMMMMVAAAPVIPPSSTLIFKLDPGTGVTLDGSNKVSNITLEGGYNAAQSNTAKRPTIATVNSFPVVRFDGASWLRIPNIQLGYITLFAVVRNVANQGYISEHNNNSFSNPGGYEYIYNTQNLEAAYRRTSYLKMANKTASGFIGSGRHTYCHRFGTSELYGTTNEMYLDSTVAVFRGPGDTEEQATYPYTIGAGGADDEPMIHDLAWMEMHRAMTDAEVTAKITSLMTTFSTL